MLWATSQAFSTGLIQGKQHLYLPASGVSRKQPVKQYTCARDLGPVRPGYVPCWIKDCCYFDALGTLVQYAQAMCHAGSRIAVTSMR